MLWYKKFLSEELEIIRIEDILEKYYEKKEKTKMRNNMKCFICNKKIWCPCDNMCKNHEEHNEKGSDISHIHYMIDNLALPRITKKNEIYHTCTSNDCSSKIQELIY